MLLATALTFKTIYPLRNSNKNNTENIVIVRIMRTIIQIHTTPNSRISFNFTVSQMKTTLLYSLKYTYHMHYSIYINVFAFNF